MAQRKSNQKGQSGRSGQQGGSKSGSQKHGTGTSRKSTMKEDEKEDSSSG
ncbi:MAG TPA: hypothetical protein VFG54_05500 [Prolixibacteraceae bacterium]|nr:hypothetical protein [Prolixibacteraceae bacterium]